MLVSLRYLKNMKNAMAQLVAEERAKGTSEAAIMLMILAAMKKIADKR